MAYSLSYRDLVELMQERRYAVDHSTVQRWVIHKVVEQVVRHSDHRLIKRIIRPMLGFKSFRSAQATLAGI